MIVAVTGANGFIGQNLIRRFQTAGWETRGIIRQDVEQGRLPALVRGADAVVHAAAATRAPSVKELRESNVTLTRRVLEAVERAEVSRFVYVSSLAAAGPAPSREHPVTEATLPTPIEAYGRSKLEAEALVRESGLPFVIVRPSAVYGPHDRDFLSVFRLARRGVAIHPANRDHWLSIIHVSDLADAILRCASAAEAVGRAYCLGNDEPVQWIDVFQMAASCAGQQLRIDVEIPKPLAFLGARVGDLVARLTGKASLATSQKLALSEPRYWVCSSELAARDLGVRPRIPLSVGFRDTYQWYLEQGWL